MTAMKRTAAELVDLEKEDVPTNAFCDQVVAELDDFSEQLLKAALEQFPEGSEREIDARQRELEDKVEEYLQAAKYGFSKVLLHISVVCAPTRSPVHLSNRQLVHPLTDRSPAHLLGIILEPFACRLYGKLRPLQGTGKGDEA